ncbi:PTS mannose transporter subunit IIA [Klebsiella sp. WP7-S18-CRE-02]|uniref:PTS lactose/cellobiose transporter subunit IIA n=1 Tax=Kluyvera genomosp. 2 TaxID=2774054 RepID=A0A2T2Y6M0_9ENTR|nr:MULTISPECIES: PTS lactose/cellobiose transporter subunit IIA [Enterobacteriaceae]HAT3917475.1 PTS lactose/cellobiose transporter subunit IIA [Kluyvera ascorbata]PSR48169.1 PTS lactose/cellobiose transporter subunit IIA [Kluyvera genomosp. 2]BBQ84764.1 PTS mannose transporter subunit IIA [Klebsiella sp. WP3-W18-ESBL-02]BBR21816.1 PTS mannose transporter subunit IIA [Klebsiella sp. WP3-S18-ESBL-05]BBR58075.1 PTS mannose transporter subunit IIA [Klebsiella sp. WP4-W18-ESBL-05]
MTDEQRWFSIIACAGESFSQLNAALQAAKSGDITQAEAYFHESEVNLQRAHHIQSESLQGEISGQPIAFSLLFVHAQDHLMNVLLAQNIYREFIELYKNK